MEAIAKQEGCRHCGLPTTEKFCCAGCETVFATLTELGLTDYYRWREDKEVTPPVSIEAPDQLIAEFDRPGIGDSPQGTYTFDIAGIHCAGCLWLLEKLPSIHPGIRRSELNATTGELTVWFSAGDVSLSGIVRLLVRLGYPPRSPVEISSARATSGGELIRVGVSGFAALNTMMLAVSLFEGLFTGIDDSIASAFRWISFAITTPVVLWAGLPLYAQAFRALRLGKVHIELPLMVAIVAAYLLSGVNTFLNRPFVYFDAVCLLIFLLLISRIIQRSALAKAQRAARVGWSLLPALVRRREGFDETEIRIEDLAAGDHVIVGPGERFPADGVILEGQSSVDRSVMTGESCALPIVKGAEVIAGSLNLSAQVCMQVVHVGEATRIGRLLKELRSHEGNKGSLTRFTDAVGRWYLAGLLVATLVTAVAHWHDWTVSLEAVLTLYIVTCPCALAFSVPTLYGMFIGEASRRGILVKSPRILENLPAIKKIYLDKTGTITAGRLSLVEDERTAAITPESLAVFATLTALQPKHPVSAALREALSIRVRTSEDARHVPGKGVELIRDGVVWRLGTPRWADANYRGIFSGKRTEVVFSRNRIAIARFQLLDAVRNGSMDAVSKLASLGKAVTLLSGDDSATARTIGQSVGLPLEACYGSLSPEEKATIVKSGVHPCMFVGDGVNDVLALRSADVGVAIAGALETIVEPADVVITKGALESVVLLSVAARRTRRVVFLSLALSLVYNVTAAGITIAGHMNPVIAAFLMPTSSLFVMGIGAWYKPFPKEPSL